MALRYGVARRSKAENGMAKIINMNNERNIGSRTA